MSQYHCIVSLIVILTQMASADLRVHRIDKLGTDAPSSPRFDHKEARAEARKVFPELAKREQWDFSQASDSKLFTEEGLKGIDVIIFDNNSGLLFDEKEKQAFEAWVRAGGGVVGIHGATHAHKGVNEKNEAEWPFWYGLWRVLHKSGPKEGPQGRRGYADWVQMAERLDAPFRRSPERWQLDKVEWYFWNYHQQFEDVQVVATADVKKNQPLLPAFYPVTWYQEYAGGRVWYTNMGHYAENFHQEAFLQQIVDGVKWVSGDDADEGRP